MTAKYPRLWCSQCNKSYTKPHRNRHLHLIPQQSLKQCFVKKNWKCTCCSKKISNSNIAKHLKRCKKNLMKQTLKQIRVSVLETTSVKTSSSETEFDFSDLLSPRIEDFIQLMAFHQYKWQLWQYRQRMSKMQRQTWKRLSLSLKLASLPDNNARNRFIKLKRKEGSTDQQIQQEIQQAWGNMGETWQRRLDLKV